jgi:hypothetical protein
MLDNLQSVDPKVLERIAKLLNITEERGATEAEALNAAERAKRMMDDHGLSTAQVEAAGGVGERRSDASLEGLAGEWWQPPLMAAIAETCYVFCELQTKIDAARRKLGAGYRLIGRESAVATAEVLYKYLCEVTYRCCREAETQHRADGTPFKKKWFRRAMGERLCERVRAEHEKALRTQREEAEARAAAQAAAGSTGTSLVVTLVDYQQRERDLNNDLLKGWPPGTTLAKREASDRDRQQYRDEQKRKRAELEAQGVSADVIQYMLYGYTRERAEEIAASNATQRLQSSEPKPKTEKQRQREQEQSDRYWQRHSERAAREEARRNSPAWRAGRQAGGEVSLNRQVDESKRRIKSS